MPIKDGIVQLAQASGEALRNIRKNSGKTTDPDLMRYESFKPEDFDKMSQDYGYDNVLEYIREMELRRLTPIK
jgi:hypothetical protein